MKREEQVRVLVVEDNARVRKMIQRLLESIGYLVVGKALNGLQAIEMTQALRPDVVVMDLRMPDMSGIEAMQRIYESCPTPVVVLSAYQEPTLVRQAGRVGAGAYLVKPPNAEEMNRAITIAIARFDDMMQLRHLNAELQAKNQELDAFAHTVAHDLKNPLNLIIGFADMLMLEAGSRLNQGQRQYLQSVVSNSRKMNNIVDELLLLAEIRKVDVEIGPLNMAVVVKEALMRLALMVEQYRPEIKLPDTWPVAWGYGPWLEEVWTNYLSNAMKYGGRPPRIQCGATLLDDGMVRFWIRDNGPGLSPEEQSRLFTPFTQLSQIRTGGHGLGLSIVRRIVEKLGGVVGVESKRGSGSTFSFTLPGRPAEAVTTNLGTG
ncbi:MAG TPA: response regulator [Anaerolineae bacterium]